MPPCRRRPRLAIAAAAILVAAAAATAAAPLTDPQQWRVAGGGGSLATHCNPTATQGNNVLNLQQTGFRCDGSAFWDPEKLIHLRDSPPPPPVIVPGRPNTSWGYPGGAWLCAAVGGARTAGQLRGVSSPPPPPLLHGGPATLPTVVWRPSLHNSALPSTSPTVALIDPSTPPTSLRAPVSRPFLQ
ncbi:hypothetical protein Hamer_G022398 [Homarus americanus]|uniref:Uncharacterized protein n=1 Tax=Homarus americanus TaxID=6706 RepID=A0A8J5TJ03_HOMAM|nr:hypothetical protein Hamer_G022398 [Homarus americanus]